MTGQRFLPQVDQYMQDCYKSEAATLSLVAEFEEKAALLSELIAEFEDFISANPGLVSASNFQDDMAPPVPMRLTSQREPERHMLTVSGPDGNSNREVWVDRLPHTAPETKQEKYFAGIDPDMFDWIPIKVKILTISITDALNRPEIFTGEQLAITRKEIGSILGRTGKDIDYYDSTYKAKIGNSLVPTIGVVSELRDAAELYKSLKESKTSDEILRKLSPIRFTNRKLMRHIIKGTKEKLNSSTMDHSDHIQFFSALSFKLECLADEFELLNENYRELIPKQGEFLTLSIRDEQYRKPIPFNPNFHPKTALTR